MGAVAALRAPDANRRANGIARMFALSLVEREILAAEDARRAATRRRSSGASAFTNRTRPVLAQNSPGALPALAAVACERAIRVSDAWHALCSPTLRIRRAHGGNRREKGRTTMANAIDLHVGKRLRRRRRLLGLTQQQLAESIGIRFQQIQKYECGANRVTASRLYELAVALNVPVNYFFEGLQQVASPANPGAPANDRDLIAADVLSQKETLELIRAYYKLGERPRRRLLDLAKALQDESTDAA
jgi:transcriptional regulator with XRE-family HTH domain